MTVLCQDGVRLDGVVAALPEMREDNLARCAALFGDAKKAEAVVQATGIRSRRIASPGVSSLDLGVAAAERLLADLDVPREEVGALVFVTFTPERAMPCNACQAQRRLGLSEDVVALDVGQACAGYAYGLYLAATLAKSTGRRALLLDADVQTPRVRPDDAATVPVLADAGSATLVSPDAAAKGPWRFAFMSRGEGGEALTLPVGGTISMDGFSVFRFVASDVRRFLAGFLEQTRVRADELAAFAPHQANVYMIRQLARSLSVPEGRLLVSGDELGNSASATVPVTMAWCAEHGRFSSHADAPVLLSGFGGGLSASAALVFVSERCRFSCVDIP